jgi:hypothetical protein
VQECRSAAPGHSLGPSHRRSAICYLLFAKRCLCVLGRRSPAAAGGEMGRPVRHVGVRHAGGTCRAAGLAKAEVCFVREFGLLRPAAAGRQRSVVVDPRS